MKLSTPRGAALLVFGWLVILILASCQQATSEVENAQPDSISAEIEPTLPPTNTPQPSTTPSPTEIVEEPTPLPAPPTFTPAPTEPLPSPTTIPPTPTAEPTAIEPTSTAEPLLEDGQPRCRSLDELANVTPSQIVSPQPWPQLNPFASEIYTGFSGSTPLIHLGFDVEGPPTVLNDLLAVLDRRQVQTTMFVVGSWAESYPDYIRDMAARGHEFANHTFSHGNMREMTAEQVLDELQSTEAVVQRLTGKTTKPWLRPPFGSRSDVSIAAAFEGGWTTVIWSGSTEDWRENATEDGMCATLLEGAFPGSILYSHSYHPDVPAVVDRFIGEMQAQGYVFVPMSVIMAANADQYLTSP